MQPITPVWNVTLARHFHAEGKPLQSSKCIISVFHPEAFVKQACSESVPLNSSFIVNSGPGKSQGCMRPMARTRIGEQKCQQEKKKYQQGWFCWFTSSSVANKLAQCIQSWAKEFILIFSDLLWYLVYPRKERGAGSSWFKMQSGHTSLINFCALQKGTFGAGLYSVGNMGSCQSTVTAAKGTVPWSPCTLSKSVLNIAFLSFFLRQVFIM